MSGKQWNVSRQSGYGGVTQKLFRPTFHAAWRFIASKPISSALRWTRNSGDVSPCAQKIHNMHARVYFYSEASSNWDYLQHIRGFSEALSEWNFENKSEIQPDAASHVRRSLTMLFLGWLNKKSYISGVCSTHGEWQTVHNIGQETSENSSTGHRGKAHLSLC